VNSTVSKAKIIKIYTDGSCRGNPGPGGYGILLKYKNSQKQISEGFRLTTNNRMELLAVIVALKSLKLDSSVTFKKFKLEIYSDSKYVIDAVNLGWAKKWQSNNWRRAKNKPALNTDLWEQLLELIEKIEKASHLISWYWVKGHSGQIENEICDKLALESSKALNLSEDRAFFQNN